MTGPGRAGTGAPPGTMRSMATRRQQIIELLEGGEHGFEELREILEVPVHVLKEDLAHVERTVRASGKRLRVSEPRCLDCGFVFRGRGKRHFHPPSRCPECRGEHVSAVRMKVR